MNIREEIGVLCAAEDDRASRLQRYYRSLSSVPDVPLRNVQDDAAAEIEEFRSVQPRETYGPLLFGIAVLAVTVICIMVLH